MDFRLSLLQFGDVLGKNSRHFPRQHVGMAVSSYKRGVFSSPCYTKTQVFLRVRGKCGHAFNTVPQGADKVFLTFSTAGLQSFPPKDTQSVGMQIPLGAFQSHTL